MTARGRHLLAVGCMNNSWVWELMWKMSANLDRLTAGIESCTIAIGYSSLRCFTPRWLFATLYPATQALEGIIVKSLDNYSWFETHHIHANPRNQGEQTEVFWIELEVFLVSWVPRLLHWGQLVSLCTVQTRRRWRHWAHSAPAWNWVLLYFSSL